MSPGARRLLRRLLFPVSSCLQFHTPAPDSDVGRAERGRIIEGGERSRDQKEELRVAGLFLALGPVRPPHPPELWAFCLTLQLHPRWGAHKDHSLARPLWLRSWKLASCSIGTGLGLNIYVHKRSAEERLLSYLLPCVDWFKSEFIPVYIAGGGLVIRSLLAGVNHCHWPGSLHNEPCQPCPLLGGRSPEPYKRGPRLLSRTCRQENEEMRRVAGRSTQTCAGFVWFCKPWKTPQGSDPQLAVGMTLNRVFT